MRTSKTSTIGKCVTCGKKFSSSEMKKHISKECFFETNKTQEGKLYYLEVMDAYDPAYWLLIAVSENATLKDIDGFLRDIWLECCGHLSSFSIDGVNYEAIVDTSFGTEAEDMKHKVKDVLIKGMECFYTYDFGSSTELVIKVLDVNCGKLKKGANIELLAANLFSKNECSSCKKIASYACPCCGEKVCEKCANEHECGDDVLSMLTNSPRCGVCGYTGGGILDTFK